MVFLWFSYGVERHASGHEMKRTRSRVLSLCQAALEQAISGLQRHGIFQVPYLGQGEIEPHLVCGSSHLDVNVGYISYIPSLL